MLQAIVFDFDGVVVDSEPLHFRALARVGQGFGFEMDWQRYLSDMIGYDDRDAIRAMLSEAGQPVDDERVAVLCRQKAQLIDRMIDKGVPMIDGARELIEAAHAEGLPIAIASGATSHEIARMLDGLGLADKFGVIVSADDVQHSKPHPRTFQLAGERLGIEPPKCLAIEDTAAGIQSAKAAGMMTLGVATTGPAEALREAGRVEPGLVTVTLDKLRAWYG